MKTNRLLIITPEFPPIGGGASSVVYELINEISKHKHIGKIDVVTMSGKDLNDIEKNDKVSIHRVGLRRKSFFYSSWFEQFLFLFFATIKSSLLQRKESFSLCHAHFAVPSGLSAFFLKKTFNLPYFITIHGSDIPKYNPDRFSLIHKFTPWIIKKVFQNANQVIAGTAFMADLSKESLGFKNIKIINHGINLDKIKPLPKKDKILICSRLVKRKGVHHIIEAINILRDISIDYSIHIIGDGPELESLKKISKSNIIFEGWLDNDSERYKKLFGESKIFIFCSSQENASNVLFEAMSAGCAIISSISGGNKEILGDSALYLEKISSDNIKSQIEYLLKNKDKMDILKSKALDRVRNFTWEKSGAEYIKVFNEVLLII